MSENTAAMNEAPATESVKPEMKRFNVSIPADQYARLVDDHRFELRLDRPEFYQHVFNEYEAGLSR